MTASRTLLQMKYTRLIAALSQAEGISLETALDFFYHSLVYELMREGLSDYHCRSDAYLLEDLRAEWRKKRGEIPPPDQK